MGNIKFETYKDYILPVIPFEDIIIDTGAGSFVTDTTGRKILDLNCGQFCTIFGHNLKELHAALANKIVNTNTAVLSVDALYALENLHMITPGMNSQSIILSTGAEAIEFAMRYAKAITQKVGLIAFDHGYHGLTLGAQAVTYGGGYAVPTHKHQYAIQTPLTNSNEEVLDRIIEDTEDILRKDNNISCIIVEPIVSVGGMHVQQPYFLKKLRKLCDDYSIFLIFDECQTGFGRTGTWFRYEAIDVIPDMLVCAKGIGLGYPVSTVSVKKSIIDQCDLRLTHYSSHQNDPLASTVINYGVDYIIKNNLLETIAVMSDYLFKGLNKLSNELSILSPPRGAGLMVGFDLVLENIDDYRPISNYLKMELLKRGVMIQVTNAGRTFRCLPSYLITLEEIDFFLENMKDVIMAFKDK